jgi:magnesium-transporting ATPase (P-type)
MIDPPRNEAKKAVSACIQAGINCNDNGDHELTARSHCKDGTKMAALSEKEFQI